MVTYLRVKVLPGEKLTYWKVIIENLLAQANGLGYPLNLQVVSLYFFLCGGLGISIHFGLVGFNVVLLPWMANDNGGLTARQSVSQIVILLQYREWWGKVVIQYKKLRPFTRTQLGI